jgi:DHA1 family bicyclomycin/chloramphenicol resistance-like MFS transporter
MSATLPDPVSSKSKERALPKGFSIAGLTFVLAALSWIGPFAIDTYLPSIPSIAKNLNASTAEVQQTMTAFLFFFAVMSLWHGAIADAYGRRKPALIAMGFFLIASLGCAFSGNVALLTVFRAIQGATAGAGMIIGRAVVRDLFEGAAAQRIMSHVATIFTIAPVMAPVIGGWFHVWFGWRSIFFFMTGMAAFLLASCWLLMPETLPRENRQRLNIAFLGKSYWKVMTTMPFLAACLALSFINIGFFIYILSAPVFLTQYLGLKETQFIVLFLPMSVAMVIGAWISGRCAGKMSGMKTIGIGYIVMATAAVINVVLNMIIPPALPWTLIPVITYVLGMSTAAPSLTLLALDLFPSQRGLAASCQGFLSLGASSIVSAVIYLFWGSTLSLAYTMLALMTGGAILLLLYKATAGNTRRKEPA